MGPPDGCAIHDSQETHGSVTVILSDRIMRGIGLGTVSRISAHKTLRDLEAEYVDCWVPSQAFSLLPGSVFQVH